LSAAVGHLTALTERYCGLIASFSRALSDGLRYSMNDIEFNETLTNNVNQIFEASIAP